VFSVGSFFPKSQVHIQGPSKVSVRDGQEGGQGREPDQLGLRELDAVLGGHVTDRLPDHPERCRGEVEEVHRHGHPPPLLVQEPDGPDVIQPAGRFANGPGDPLRRVLVGPREVDVEGHQGLARPDPRLQAATGPHRRLPLLFVHEVVQLD